MPQKADITVKSPYENDMANQNTGSITSSVQHLIMDREPRISNYIQQFQQRLSTKSQRFLGNYSESIRFIIKFQVLNEQSL